MPKKTIEIMINGKKENKFVMDDTEDYALPDVHAFVELIKGWLFNKLLEKRNKK